MRECSHQVDYQWIVFTAWFCWLQAMYLLRLIYLFISSYSIKLNILMFIGSGCETLKLVNYGGKWHLELSGATRK